MRSWLVNFCMLILFKISNGFLQSRNGIRRTGGCSAIRGPPIETKPDYDAIVGPLGRAVDDFFLNLFRQKLEENVGFQTNETGYAAIIDLTAKLNARYSDRKEIQRRAENTLIDMFPSWLPGSYAVLFSKPFPKFSARMNAWATWWAGTWLMGECEINDIVADGGVPGPAQGLLVQRCRFLEEAGCASVCVNSCKIPTQHFFMQEMGLPLTMEPNYDTFECQFSFGKTPTPETEFDAVGTPCLMRCPTAGALRDFHSKTLNTAAAATSHCYLMKTE